MAIDITIGFTFSKRIELLGRNIWKQFEVIGFKYGTGSNDTDEPTTYPDWKSKEDILKLKKYIQIMDLPDNSNNQLSIKWESLEQLQNEIEEDYKLSSKFRRFKL